MTGTIDPDQAAQLLGISLSEVRALVKARVIPKVNKHKFVSSPSPASSKNRAFDMPSERPPRWPCG
jgi:hypothetical protein